MNNVKKITLILDGDINEDLGEEISFEPKFHTHVSMHKGIGQTNSIYSMIPEMGYNGKEVLVILSAPPDILEILKPIIDSTVKGLING